MQGCSATWESPELNYWINSIAPTTGIEVDLIERIVHLRLCKLDAKGMAVRLVAEVSHVGQPTKGKYVILVVICRTSKAQGAWSLPQSLSKFIYRTAQTTSE